MKIIVSVWFGFSILSTQWAFGNIFALGILVYNLSCFFLRFSSLISREGPCQFLYKQDHVLDHYVLCAVRNEIFFEITLCADIPILNKTFSTIMKAKFFFAV